jgi:hypothetical protein
VGKAAKKKLEGLHHPDGGGSRLRRNNSSGKRTQGMCPVNVAVLLGDLNRNLLDFPGQVEGHASLCCRVAKNSLSVYRVLGLLPDAVLSANGAKCRRYN